MVHLGLFMIQFRPIVKHTTSMFLSWKGGWIPNVLPTNQPKGDRDGGIFSVNHARGDMCIYLCMDSDKNMQIRIYIYTAHMIYMFCKNHKTPNNTLQVCFGFHHLHSFSMLNNYWFLFRMQILFPIFLFEASQHHDLFRFLSFMWPWATSTKPGFRVQAISQFHFFWEENQLSSQLQKSFQPFRSSIFWGRKINSHPSSKSLWVLKGSLPSPFTPQKKGNMSREISRSSLLKFLSLFANKFPTHIFGNVDVSSGPPPTKTKEDRTCIV